MAETDIIRNFLIGVYEKKNPLKVKDVDFLLKKYNKEVERKSLLKKIITKYRIFQKEVPPEIIHFLRGNTKKVQKVRRNQKRRPGKRKRETETKRRPAKHSKCVHFFPCLFFLFSSKKL